MPSPTRSRGPLSSTTSSSHQRRKAAMPAKSGSSPTSACSSSSPISSLPSHVLLSRRGFRTKRGAGHRGGGPTPNASMGTVRRSACALRGLFQLLGTRCLPLGLALGPLLLGAHLLGFACLLQRAALIGTSLTHLAGLEDDQRADGLLARPRVGAGETEGPYAVGTDDDPRLLQLPPVQEIGLGRR